MRALFENAVDHPGPEVTVRVGSQPDGFFVADDGPGVDPAETDRVREVGYSSRPAAGLGLALVDHVADALGWETTVTESATGGLRAELAGLSGGS